MSKINVFDLPLVKTQKFRVRIEGNPATFMVERKEVLKQQHNMICTDGMKEGETRTIVDYDVWQDVDMETTQKVIKAVEDEINVKN